MAIKKIPADATRVKKSSDSSKEERLNKAGEAAKRGAELKREAKIGQRFSESGKFKARHPDDNGYYVYAPGIYAKRNATASEKAYKESSKKLKSVLDDNKKELFAKKNILSNKKK